MPAWKVWFDPVVASISNTKSEMQILRPPNSSPRILSPTCRPITSCSLVLLSQYTISSFTLGCLHNQGIGGLKPLGGKSAFVEHLFPLFSCSHLYVSLLDHACFDHSIIFNFLASNLKIFFLNFTSQFSRKSAMIRIHSMAAPAGPLSSRKIACCRRLVTTAWSARRKSNMVDWSDFAPTISDTQQQ
jgi:hypothetical protein